MCTICTFTVATHRVIHEIKGTVIETKKLVPSKFTRNRVINFNATFASNRFLFSRVNKLFIVQEDTRN